MWVSHHPWSSSEKIVTKGKRGPHILSLLPAPDVAARSDNPANTVHCLPYALGTHRNRTRSSNFQNCELNKALLKISTTCLVFCYNNIKPLPDTLLSWLHSWALEFNRHELKSQLFLVNDSILVTFLNFWDSFSLPL